MGVSRIHLAAPLERLQKLIWVKTSLDRLYLGQTSWTGVGRGKKENNTLYF